MTVHNNKEIALKIQATAKELGWKVFVRGGVLTITKAIEPKSKEDFVKADGEYFSILSLLPQTSPGSTWGTDGGGIGALSAMEHGQMTMNKSGGNKRILKELANLVQ